MQQYFAIILLLNVRVVDIPLALIIAEIVVIIPSDLFLHMALSVGSGKMGYLDF